MRGGGLWRCVEVCWGAVRRFVGVRGLLGCGEEVCGGAGIVGVRGGGAGLLGCREEVCGGAGIVGVR